MTRIARLRAAWRRWLWLWRYPCYRRTGARIVEMADDLTRVRVKLPLNRKTRGYFGPLFGGSIYAVTDPIYMVMLNRALGPGYEAWDREATIRFRRPGWEALYADFELAPPEVDAIRAELDRRPWARRRYLVELKTADGTVCATVEKTLLIRKSDDSGGSG